MANVPDWLPGAGFKRVAREWHETLEEMVAAPYKFVKDQMVTKIRRISDQELKFQCDRLLVLPRNHSPRICWKAVLCLPKRITL